MASASIDRMKQEFDREKSALLKELEKIAPYGDQALTDDERVVVTEFDAYLRKRISLVEMAVGSLDALALDGYPELDMQAIAPVHAKVAKSYDAEAKRLHEMAQGLTTPPKAASSVSVSSGAPHPATPPASSAKKDEA